MRPIPQAHLPAQASIFALMGALAGMILTKETYVIHVTCAVIAVGVAWVLGNQDLINGRDRW